MIIFALGKIENRKKTNYHIFTLTSRCTLTQVLLRQSEQKINGQGALVDGLPLKLMWLELSLRPKS